MSCLFIFIVGFTTERDCPFLCEWMKNWKQDRESKYIIKHKYCTFSVYILYIQYIHLLSVRYSACAWMIGLWFYRQISVKQLPLFTAYHMFIADTVQNVLYNTFTAILVYWFLLLFFYPPRSESYILSFKREERLSCWSSWFSTGELWAGSWLLYLPTYSV